MSDKININVTNITTRIKNMKNLRSQLEDIRSNDLENKFSESKGEAQAAVRRTVRQINTTMDYQIDMMDAIIGYIEDHKANMEAADNS